MNLKLMAVGFVYWTLIFQSPSWAKNLAGGSVESFKSVCFGRLHFQLPESMNTSRSPLYQAFDFQIEQRDETNPKDQINQITVTAEDDLGNHAAKEAAQIEGRLSLTNSSIFVRTQVHVGPLTPKMVLNKVVVPKAKRKVKSLLKSYQTESADGYCVGTGAFHKSPDGNESVNVSFSDSKEISITVESDSKNTVAQFSGLDELEKKKLMAGKREGQASEQNLKNRLQKSWVFTAKDPGPLKPHIFIQVEGPENLSGQVELIFKRILDTLETK